jgi:hypothetical protein
MHTPSKFEEFLSAKVARKHMSELSSFKRLYAEVRPDPKEITSLFGEDMGRFQRLRTSIRECMLGGPAEKLAEATTWIAFLKARIELLDFHTSFYGNFAAYLGGAVALWVTLEKFFKFSNDIIFALLGAVAAMGFAGFRATIDRRKAWYKFLVAHLEVIRNDLKGTAA